MKNFLRRMGFHFHDYDYGHRGIGGWGVVRCADPDCNYVDIF